MKDTKLGRTHASRSCYGWDRWAMPLFCCWFRDFPPFFLMCVFFFYMEANHGNMHQQNASCWSISSISRWNLFPPAWCQEFGVFLEISSAVCFGCVLERYDHTCRREAWKRTSSLFPYRWTWRNIPCWSIVGPIILSIIIKSNGQAKHFYLGYCSFWRIFQPFHSSWRLRSWVAPSTALLKEKVQRPVFFLSLFLLKVSFGKWRSKLSKILASNLRKKKRLFGGKTVITSPKLTWQWNITHLV